MHNGATSGRRLSASSSTSTTGTKLDSEAGSGRMSSRRQSARAGRTSGRASPMASSSQHSQHGAALSASLPAVDSQLVATSTPARTVSAAAGVSFAVSDIVVTSDVRASAVVFAQQAQHTRMGWKQVILEKAAPVVQFVQTIGRRARDPVAVADALLWLVLLPLVLMRRTVHSPGAVALLRVTLEAAAELMVAAMLAGAAICITAMHVLAEDETDMDSSKRADPAQHTCCRSVQLEPMLLESTLPVDAAGERCTPQSVLSPAIPPTLH